MYTIFLLGLIVGLMIYHVLCKCQDKLTLSNIIVKLTRQAARWTTAARQDKNVMIQVLHANYGTGYLWALRDIATDTEIKNATGIDILEFEKEIVQTQDASTLRMAKICPKYAPEKSYLTSIGGEH